MAGRQKTFKKYEENHRKTERFLKNIDKAGKKARSASRKYARQKESERNKRLREYRREKEKREKTRQKEYNKNLSQPHEPATFGDFLLLIGLFAVLIIMFVLFFKIGFWKTIILAVVVFFAGIVASVIMDDMKAKRNAREDQYLEDKPEDRCDHIPYLNGLMDEIKRHQTIVNTSSDPDEVKIHLDCLIGVMDEIASFDEDLLKQAGMTKANYESAKADLLEVYDTMIEQARKQTET